MVEAVRRDREDKEFVELCRRESGAQSWSLSLAKVPPSLQTNDRGQADRAMQHVLSGPYKPVVPEPVPEDMWVLSEDASDWRRLAQREAEDAAKERVYDEVWFADPDADDREGIEYRFATYPVEIGESIMLNHAIFAGLGLKGATPVTDDRFHQRALAHKLGRDLQDPAVAEFLDADSVRANALALAALTDTDLELPAMAPEIPLEEVLAYRARHRAELEEAREALWWLAREIVPTPADKDFAETIRRKAIPEVRKKLRDAQSAQKSWLKQRKAALVKLTGLSAGHLAAVIGLAFAAMPPLAIGAVGVLGAVAVGAEAVPAIGALRGGSRDTPELQYFIELRRS